MPNHMKFCSCRSCKAGKRTPRAKLITRLVIRAARHQVKLALHKGNEPLNVASVPYTD